MSHPRSPWIWWRFYSSSCLQRQVSNDRENSEPITPLNSKYKLSFLLDISCIIHESKWRRFAPLFLLKDFFFYLFCWRAPFFLWKCLCFKIQNWLILLERVCETASNHILGFFSKICDAYRPGSAFGRKRYVHGCSSCCGTDLCNSNCMLLYYTSFDLNKKKKKTSKQHSSIFFLLKT